MGYFKEVVFLFCVTALYCIDGEDQPCRIKEFGTGNIVCVCSADYCDFTTIPKRTHKGRFHVFTSTESGQRFQRTNGYFDQNRDRKIKNRNGKSKKKSIHDTKNKHTSSRKRAFLRANERMSEIITMEEFTVVQKSTYQEIQGFGGAFTDSTGINIQQLSDEVQEYLMRSYFSSDGLEYSIGRVPIGATDFSTHPYTYNDYPENDTNLSNFSLANEDITFKIPYIQRAIKFNPKLRLFATAWTSPRWMKTNNDWSGKNQLIEEYYQSWADYHIKFLEAYKSHDIPMWGLTTGNEPINGIQGIHNFVSLGWVPSTQATWVAENLGPTLRASAFKDVKVIALDDERWQLTWWIDQMGQSNAKSLEYLDAIGLHWYTDTQYTTELLLETHKKYPNKFMLGTEACAGFPDGSKNENEVLLGSWDRGEEYMQNIIQNLNNWVAGWTDWNLALDQQGGPNYVGNFVDSPIIVNNMTNEFYKQPMFYALGHFSKFVPAGSKRVQLNQRTVQGRQLDSIAFSREDGGLVIVLLNRYTTMASITINDDVRGQLRIQVPAKSFQTILYW